MARSTISEADPNLEVYEVKHSAHVLVSSVFILIYGLCAFITVACLLVAAYFVGSYFYLYATQVSWFLVLVFSIPLAAAVIFYLEKPLATRVAIDTKVHRISVLRRGLLWESVAKYHTDQAVEVQLKSFVPWLGMPEVYEAYLLLDTEKDIKKVPIGCCRSHKSRVQLEETREIAKKAARFLSVPYKEIYV